MIDVLTKALMDKLLVIQACIPLGTVGSAPVNYGAGRCEDDCMQGCASGCSGFDCEYTASDD